MLPIVAIEAGTFVDRGLPSVVPVVVGGGGNWEN